MDFQMLLFWCRAPVRFSPIYNKESEQIKAALVSFIRRGKKTLPVGRCYDTTVEEVTADKHYSKFLC